MCIFLQLGMGWIACGPLNGKAPCRSKLTLAQRLLNVADEIFR